MLKYVGYTLIILIATITLYSPEVQSNPPLPSEFCRKVFFGTIGDDLTVRMQIERYENTLRGSYFYTKYHQPIRIDGTIDEHGRFTLEEYGEPGMLTGTFEGIYSLPDTMQGRWFDAHRRRSYAFQLKRITGIDRYGETPEGKHFEVIREPQADDTDRIFVRIEGERMVALYEESCYAYLDIDSVRVTKLSGQPNLFQITWSTHPEGQGNYTYRYYLIIPERNTPSILAKGVVSSGKAGWCWWGHGDYTIQYGKNTLVIIEQYQYQTCSEPGELQTFIQLGESKISRTYTVQVDEVNLVHAEHYQRVVEDKDLDKDLRDALEASDWEKQEIPLQEALKKYPAVNHTRP